MRDQTKRELASGAQYLIIGLIAELVVHFWQRRGRAEGLTSFLLWLSIFIALSIARLVTLFLARWLKRDQWRNVSRRYWE